MTESTPSSSQKDVLLLFYVENARQARHYEEQRQSLTNAIVLAAAVVVAGVAIGGGRAAAAASLSGLFLVGLGCFGFLASLRSHERSRLHVERLHAVRDEIARHLVDVAALYESARAKHARRYPRLSELTARVHYLWQAVHVGVAGLGVLLLAAGALGG